MAGLLTRMAAPGDGRAADAGAQGLLMGPLGYDQDRARFSLAAHVANVDVVAPRCEIKFRRTGRRSCEHARSCCSLRAVVRWSEPPLPARCFQTLPMRLLLRQLGNDAPARVAAVGWLSRGQSEALRPLPKWPSATTILIPSPPLSRRAGNPAAAIRKPAGAVEWRRDRPAWLEPSRAYQTNLNSATLSPRACPPSHKRPSGASDGIRGSVRSAAL